MKKKVLFIIWSNSFGGGAESQLTNLVNNLNKDKYDIDVIEYFHSDIKQEKLNSYINELPPINNKVTESKIKRKIINILMYICPKLVRKKYIKNKYDVEVSFNYLFPTFLLDKKTKNIAWIHGSIYDISRNNNLFLHILQKRHLKQIDKIVAISNSTELSIKEVYPEFKDKISLIHNGYDYKKMDLLSQEKLQIKEDKRFKILYCNRFDDNKNPLLLIEAAKLLKEKTDNFHITFLGTGNLIDEMTSTIKKYKLSDNITIVGYVKNPYPYIKNTDIISITSKSEGFSTTIIEGIYFGKPFVSSCGGVSPEIKKEKIGLVASTKEEVSKAIYKLINNKALYDKLSSKCIMVAEKYSLENQVKQTEKLIDNLLKNGVDKNEN